jgi:hypothetical protein
MEFDELQQAFREKAIVDRDVMAGVPRTSCGPQVATPTIWPLLLIAMPQAAKCEQSRQSKSIGFRLIMHQCSINAPNRRGEDETDFRGPGCSLFRCEDRHMGGSA